MKKHIIKIASLVVLCVACFGGGAYYTTYKGDAKTQQTLQELKEENENLQIRNDNQKLLLDECTNQLGVGFMKAFIYPIITTPQIEPFGELPHVD